MMNEFLLIDRAGFAQAFAADADPVEARVMAATQKPLSLKSFVASLSLVRQHGNTYRLGI